MLLSLFILIVLLYGLELFLLRLGMEKADASPIVTGYEPTVSVIVAARNEELYIEKCIRSLASMDYPAEKIEIIIVNDHSTDNTQNIINHHKTLHPGIKAITPATPGGNLWGKTNAVTHGIENSSGEILMFTDADCTVKPSWVRETVKYFDKETGIVGGFTQLTSSRIFEGIQALDWMFLFGLASATAGWNIPLTAIGNNLSVRRNAYDATGGYRKIPFSVTEDYSLVQAVLTMTNYRLRFPLNEGSLVFSNACQSFTQLFRQKQRWGVGGLDMIPRGKVIMAVGWIFRILFLVMLATGNLLTAGAGMLFIVIMEGLFLEKPIRKFGIQHLLKNFFVFEVYFFLYVLLLPFIAILSRQIVWKERKLDKSAP